MATQTFALISSLVLKVLLFNIAFSFNIMIVDLECKTKIYVCDITVFDELSNCNYHFHVMS